MSPTELALQPVGTRISFGYDYGTVVQDGAVVQIKWDSDQGTSIIDTKSDAWKYFILDMEVVPQGGMQ